MKITAVESHFVDRPVAIDPGDLLEPYVDDAARLRVTEASGRAGDVTVRHSKVLHVTPVHTGTEPGFLVVRLPRQPTAA